MVKDYFLGTTVINMMENGTITKKKDLEFIPGLMEMFIKENGLMIELKGEVFLNGQMEIIMKGNG